MKYNINIPQKQAIELSNSLDVIDLCIFDFIKDYSNSKHCKKMTINDEQYYLISWKLIVNQLPLLRINTRQGINKRIRHLVDAKILIPYEKNSLLGKSWYAFGDNYEKLIYWDRQESIENLSTSVSTPVNDRLQHLSTSVSTPVNERLHNNNTTYNNINNKYIYIGDEKIFDLKKWFKNEYPAFIEVYEKEFSKFDEAVQEFLKVNIERNFNNKEHVRNSFRLLWQELDKGTIRAKSPETKNNIKPMDIHDLDIYPRIDMFVACEENEKAMESYLSALHIEGWREEIKGKWKHEKHGFIVDFAKAHEKN